MLNNRMLYIIVYFVYVQEEYADFIKGLILYDRK